MTDTGMCPHGNFRPCELCLNEAMEPGLRTRDAWQKAEDFAGEEVDFAQDTSVGFAIAMGEDRKGEGKSGHGEDMVSVDKRTGITVVSDGMGGEGGRGAGAKASAYAGERVSSLYVETSARLEKTDDRANAVNGLLKAKNMVEGMAPDATEEWWNGQPREVQVEALRLFETVKALSEEIKKTGGKATFVGGKTIVADGRRYEVVVSIGDSIAVKQGADGKVEPISMEDSAFEMMQARGMLPKEGVTDEMVQKVTRGRFKSIKDLRRAATQSLGDKTAMPHVSIVPVEDESKVIYMTDGVTKGLAREDGSLDTEKLAGLLGGDRGAGESTRAVVEAARVGQRETGNFDDLGLLIKDFTPEAEIVD